MIGVIRSEWVKLRSVNSTWNTLGVIAALVLLMGFMAWQGVQGWDQLSPERRTRFEAPPLELIVLPFLQLCAAVLGILAITSEYVTGTIQASFAAVPRRLELLIAKAAIVAGVAFIVGLSAPVATHFLSQAIVGERSEFPSYAALASSETPMLLGLALSVATAALIGLGVGAVLRAASAALMTMTSLVVMLPILARMLPEPWGDRAASITLLNLPGQIHAAQEGVFSPLGALLMLMMYVIVALGAGALAVCQRDA